ncbi:MAG: acetyl-CoA decarbonylase/synthase complex subunit gamma [Candidatus Aureabacteria bacterium]|nr:acetyl-CoA decarbonylase/synthase complex subunit gamma [Candidatus Auribacterota bacterium]
MKLTGLQIFKLLPNKNCKECGFQTCLAFAMKLAGKQAKLDACPYASDEAREKLGAASAPPIRLVKIGVGEREVQVGEELVMFRHEKTFYRKTALAAQVDDAMAPAERLARVEAASAFSVDRAGETLRLDLIAVKETSGDPRAFAAAARGAREASPLPLVLVSRNIDCLRAALEAVKDSRPLLWGADADTVEKAAALAKECAVPLVVESADGADALAALAVRAAEAGAEELLLAPRTENPATLLQDCTLLRRRALARSCNGAGFPLAVSAGGCGHEAAAVAAAAICKYASVLVLESPEQWEFLPLLTLRQNIYTDPQRPLQVDPGVYKIGDPGDDAPLLVTTNFSLTYFMVSTEIEASEIPARLLITEAEGQSVLTAWAAGKFNADLIAKAVAAQGLDTSVPHKRIIIPGYVAMISGDLEDKLPGWNVMVGPQESADIPSYLKDVWKR